VGGAVEGGGGTSEGLLHRHRGRSSTGYRWGSRTRFWAAWTRRRGPCRELAIMSVCVLCGSPLEPSPPVVGSLRVPPSGSDRLITEWRSSAHGPALRGPTLATLHDIAITNMVCCLAYKRGVGGRAYIAQWSCNSIAIGSALQVGGGR